MDFQVQDLYYERESNVLHGNLNIQEAKSNILYTTSLTLTNQVQIGNDIHQKTSSKSTLIQFIKVENEEEMPEQVCETLSVHHFDDEFEHFGIDIPSQLPTLRSFNYSKLASSTTQIHLLCFTSEDGLLARKTFEIDLFNYNKKTTNDECKYLYFPKDN